VAAFRERGERFAPVVRPFPPMVLVDVTTRCNLTCRHCPNSALSEEPGFLGDIDVDLYRHVVDQVAEFPDTLFRPFDGGEPLMRRDIGDLVGYAKQKGIRRVWLTTNGTLLTERIGKALVDAGLDQIEVSIDAASAATYLEVRQSRVFDRVVANTLRYIDMVRSAGGGRPVQVSFVKQQANAHEVDAFVAFWSGKADAVYIREAHEHNGFVSPLIHLGGGRPAADARSHRHPCPYLFNRLIVHHDGSVRFCEADWKAEHAIGNARTERLQDLWLGEQYRRLRESHVAGTFEHPFCRTCTDWRAVHW
jgi:radical SAM protein with 4Fe4S-binding SPASM domain